MSNNLAEKEIPTAEVERALCILIVDDQEINRMLVLHILRLLGYRVVVARDGREAVAAWEEGGIDLILMDIQMPLINGLEATAIIRSLEAENGAYTPIIACSAQYQEKFPGELAGLGFDGLVPKPINLNALQSEISRCCELKKPRPA